MLELDAHLARVEAEISRTDTKSSLLLAFTGAALAGLFSAAGSLDHITVAVKVTGAATGLVLVLAADLLLCVVRPRLSGSDRASFPYWATADQDEIAAAAAVDTRAAQIQVLSRITVTKYERLQRACGLLRAALVLATITAALAAVTA